jgi:predicted Zn-dependent peptidase
MIINKKPTIKNMGAFSIQFLNSISVEKIGYRGISHLVEHCMCEKLKELENDFIKYGLSYNAGTSSTGVCFYLTGLDKYVCKFKNEFIDAILNYEITEDVFNREKNIIVQEYIQSFSNQQSEFLKNFSRKMFNDYGAIGFIDDIKNITYNDFMSFKNEFFSIPDYLINVSNHKLKIKNIDKKIIKNVPNEIPANFSINDNNKIKYESYSSYDENRCILLYSFFNDEQKNYERFLYNFIFCRYMSDGLSSPLYKEIREKLQCVYNIGSMIKNIDNKNFMLFTILFTTNDNVKRVENELIKCYQNIELKEDRFNDIICSLKIEEEKSNIMDQIKAEDDDFNKQIKKLIENTKFNFEKFKSYVNEFLRSNITVTNDLKFKNECEDSKNG